MCIKRSRKRRFVQHLQHCLLTSISSHSSSTFFSVRVLVLLYFLAGTYKSQNVDMMYAATLLSLLPLLAVAAPHQQPGAGMKQGGMSCSPQGSNKAVKVGKAVYVITNEAQNAVLALAIGADGKLSAGKMAKTGGAGSSAVDAQGKPEAPDGLASQSALTVAGNVSLLQLSDHISCFRVLEWDTKANILPRTYSLSTQDPTHSP